MEKKDTKPEALKILIDIYRKMSPASKASRIFQAYQTGRILAIAGLRLSHPQANDKQLWYLWAKEHLGNELFQKVYGTLPDEKI